MSRTPSEGLQNDIRMLLHSYPKGLSIEEISTHLSISRTTTAKYLNAMEQTGQIDSRPFGPAKVFTLANRVPLENLVSLLPHLILALDENLIIQQVNDAVLTFFHLSKNDLIGRELQFTPFGVYLNEVRTDLIYQALEGESQYIEEDITRDGTTTFFFVRIVPTIFDNGEKGVILIFEDITPIKQIQSHLEELVHERTEQLESVNKKLCEENAKYKKVKTQLATNQRQYERLVENSTDLILKFSDSGNLLYHNPIASSVLSINPSDENTLQSLLSLGEEADIDVIGSIIPSLLHDPATIQRRELLHQSGENQVWISWTFRSIPTSSTDSCEIVGIGTDISDRIRSEQRLTESEQFLSNILSHLPDPTFVINSQGKIVFWNRAIEEMTGIASAYVIGKDRTLFTPSIFGYSRPILADVVFDPGNPDLLKYFENLQNEHGVLTAETKGVDTKGNDVVFWVKVTPLLNHEGIPTGAIQSMRDITSMRVFERNLIESEGTVRAILDASKDLIVVLDHTTRYSYVNAAYEKIFHCSNDTLKGKTLEEYPLPGDPHFWDLTIASLMQRRLGNRVEVQIAYDGRDLVLDCYLIPYFPKPLEKLHLLITMRDVSSIKGANTALWEDEITLKEIGSQVSKGIPLIQLKNWIMPLPLIAIVLLACLGNVI